MEKTYNGRVSIIVPIYQGKKYIHKLIKMEEMCQEKAQNQQGIELILSNDDPHEKIEESLFSDTITIHILNTEINRGIQAARIRGLEAANGDFVKLDRTYSMHTLVL